MLSSYLRWSGGKSRILSDVLETIGDCSGKTFIEPFVGSGTVALNVEADDYILNDYNKRLIITHSTIINKPTEVIREMELLYLDGRDSYYHYRDVFNTHDVSDVKMAALFVYLNRHGYNGMYRENKKGGFNIPVGKGSIMFPKTDIEIFSTTLKSEYFHNEDFEKIMEFAGKDDVIYCDPPYPTATKSGSEIDYTKSGFSKKDHIRLRDCCLSAAHRGSKVIVSYCDIPFIRELYKDAGDIMELDVRRSVGADTKSRVKAKELIITINGK